MNQGEVKESLPEEDEEPRVSGSDGAGEQREAPGALPPEHGHAAPAAAPAGSSPQDGTPGCVLKAATLQPAL